MLAFVTSLRHPDNAGDYAEIERLLERTLRSVTQQSSDDYVVIVVGNRRPSFPLPPRTRFVPVDFPPPAGENGPHAARDLFVRDKGSKIGVGLLEARRDAPDYVMIFDADDFVHRDLARWVSAQRPRQDGWFVDDGWMYSGARGAGTPIRELHRTCGTCYIVPWHVYEVPEDLAPDASQEEVIAAYGEILPNILGAHRNAVQWHRERGREMRPLPFAGAVYHVDTGENHSGKSLSDPKPMLPRDVAREFGIVHRHPWPVRWWRSSGPGAYRSMRDFVRDAPVARPLRAVLRGPVRVARGVRERLRRSR